MHIGDIICVRKRTYYHYGIYVGEGQMVHFASEASDRNYRQYVIHLTTVAEYRRIGKSVLISFGKLRSPMSIVDILSKVHKELGKKGYDFLFNNCAHFVCESVWGSRRFAVLRLILIRILVRCTLL